MNHRPDGARPVARSPGTNPPPSPNPEGAGGYTVVARRYRPQRFEDVVGQDHVVRALRNAIRLDRVTHAYLFSGTRGVGKTSVARIFAKCLNCVQGPTEEPCNECDICQAISVGQDIDVIEIDGASNNGVEAVRELRQNAGLRPSRARYKIYYIDEVHMLSTGAFNALLKTLEEPPGHVKFFFATTEPNKIPITVLSRCQRYDFAGITPDQIASTLAEICEREGVKADEDALRTIARRASGSMRDAQSLLEQLLSFGGDTLTAELVHQQLGIASDERTLDLLDALADRDPATVLTLIDQAVAGGVQPAEMLGGALDFLRDAMVLSAGANAALLAATPRQRPRIKAVTDRWPLDTILAAQQILAEARMKLRGSPHGRLLVELALVRVARLESMTELSEVIGRLAGLETDGPPAAPPEKKKPLAAEPAPDGAAPDALAAGAGRPASMGPRRDPRRLAAMGRGVGGRPRLEADPGRPDGHPRAKSIGGRGRPRLQLGRRRLRHARGPGADRGPAGAVVAAVGLDPVRPPDRRSGPALADGPEFREGRGRQGRPDGPPGGRAVRGPAGPGRGRRRVRRIARRVRSCGPSDSTASIEDGPQ